MERYHPLKSLAPRDVVARAIDAELKRTGDDYVFLDMTHLDPDFLVEHFPTIYAQLPALRHRHAHQPIPVVPAAHYTCGGVVTDDHGRTTVPSLYAIGEVALTGLHGANRLASNSLLEGAGLRRAAPPPTCAASSRCARPQVAPWDAGAAIDRRTRPSSSRRTGTRSAA